MKRINCLESVRGLASVLVLFSHLGVMFYPAFYWGGVERTHLGGFDAYFGQTPFAFILNGNSGIFLLLIITGFGSYQICKRQIDYIRQFVILRYFKLLILCILSTLIVFLLVVSDLTFYQGVIERLNTPWFDGYNPTNISYFHSLFNDPLYSLSGYNNVLWSMRIFFIGSIVTILLSLITKGYKKRWLLYIITVIVCINLQEPYYCACVAGVILADCYDMFSDTKIKTIHGIIMFAIGIYLCGYPSGVQTGFGFYKFLPFKYMLYYHLFGGVCIIYAVLFTEIISKIFSTGIFQFSGRYSASVYIVYYCVLISFSAYLFMKLDAHFTYNVSSAITCLCTIIAVFTVAYIVEKIVKLIYKYFNYIYDRLFK